MSALASAAPIRTAPQTRCVLCGNPGQPLYTDLRDRFFGVAGAWRLARCTAPQCGLLWMDPMPLAEDVGNAYASYYTHATRSAAGPRSLIKRTYDAVRRGYLAARYGYGSGPQRSAIRILGWLLYLFPIRRSGVDDEVRRLRACRGGRLLDVGCGSGDWLCDMQALGWDVAGVDFDSCAVAAATRRGLRVACGSLEAQRHPDASFDAVMLNHVIEHVPDPVATLAECFRILKRGGQLMVFTPNSASLGHRIFRGAWRGLEPPRHLHLFGPSSMRAALSRAGVTGFELRTVNSEYMWRQSAAHRMLQGDSGGPSTFGIRVAAQALALFEQALLAVRCNVGECIAVRALKP